MMDDDDDLKALAAGLRRAPAPDMAARDRALRLAEENFDRLQASAPAPRLNPDRPKAAGFWNGVTTMLQSLKRQQGLMATASVAALAIGIAAYAPLTTLTEVSDLPVDSEPVLPATVDDTAPAEMTAPKARNEGRDVLAGTLPARDRAPATGIQPEAPAPVAPAREPAVTMLTEEAARAAPGADDGALMRGLFEGDALAQAAEAEAEIGNFADATVAAPAASAAPSDLVLAPPPFAEGTEEFANAPANPVKVTAEEPVSTFSTDVDTASYAVIRSTLQAGVLPLPEQVRIEEMVNYFPYAYRAPEGDEAFSTTLAVMPTPWNPGTRLVTIGIQGALPAIAERPPLNLVFLIDTSGSMDDPAKLGLLKQSLAMALPQLRPEDQVAIVAYAGSAGLVLPPTKAGDSGTILAALDALNAGGSTAGAEGIALAYDVARQMSGDGEVSRVLLATDGDFNVGIDDPEQLTDFIAQKRDAGVYLSVLGFGRGNLDDATMQALAQNGNGQAAYIDTLSEARKVLVDQLTGALFPIAADMKVQVEWNPAEVAEYRLIGYETRALRREDFANDAVDAGDVGAGLQVTAIYEVTAPGSPAILNTPLRYGEAGAAEAPAGDATGELGFLRLRWKTPGEARSQLVETPILQGAEATGDTRFAAAIAGFGQLLSGGTYVGDWGWDEAIALAQGARGEDAFGYRIEAVNLMRLAQSFDR